MNRGILNPIGYKRLSPATPDIYFSNSAFTDFNNQVETTDSKYFIDTGRRIQIQRGVYMGNRIALDFRNTGYMYKRDLDVGNVVESYSIGTQIYGKPWYFGDDRVLTDQGIIDSSGHWITRYNFGSVTLGDLYTVWAIDFNGKLYKGTVLGQDVISFRYIQTFEDYGPLFYGKLGLYMTLPSSDNIIYINPTTLEATEIEVPTMKKSYGILYTGADGKMYGPIVESSGSVMFMKIGTEYEGVIGSYITTYETITHWTTGKFLGHSFVGVQSRRGTSTYRYYGASYEISPYIQNGRSWQQATTDFIYGYADTVGYLGFIDETGLIYTSGYGTVLQPGRMRWGRIYPVTYSDLNRKNPYYRL